MPAPAHLTARLRMLAGAIALALGLGAQAQSLRPAGVEANFAAASLLPYSLVSAKDVPQVGIKLRLAGDASYGWLPLVSAGVGLRQAAGLDALESAGLLKLRQLGLRDARGSDLSLSASKLLFNDSLLLNGSLRAVRPAGLALAGERTEAWQGVAEASAAWFVNRKWVVGAEYRLRPASSNAPGVDGDKSYGDIYVAYFPTKNLSLSLAYASLGDLSLASQKRQGGAFMSLQYGF